MQKGGENKLSRVLQKHKYILSKEVSQDVLSQPVERGLGAQKERATCHGLREWNKVKEFQIKIWFGSCQNLYLFLLSFPFILVRAVTLGSGLLTASKLRRILVLGPGASYICVISQSSALCGEHWTSQKQTNKKKSITIAAPILWR